MLLNNRLIHNQQKKQLSFLLSIKSKGQYMPRAIKHTSYVNPIILRVILANLLWAFSNSSTSFLRYGA